MRKPLVVAATLTTLALAVTPLAGSAVAGGHHHGHHGDQHGHHHTQPGLPGGYKHLVVIYEENHSFDNLFGGWGDVGGDTVTGIGSSGYADPSTQVNRNGVALTCLPQNDVNLTSPPLDAACGSVPLANNSLVNS